MSSRTLGLNRFTAAACATLITAASAWAFVNSTAASERDPFQFAAIMTANATVLSAQLESHRISACRNTLEAAKPQPSSATLVCSSSS